jgi:hypothetical protein
VSDRRWRRRDHHDHADEFVQFVEFQFVEFELNFDFVHVDHDHGAVVTP